jgi:hypothetical protein
MEDEMRLSRSTSKEAGLACVFALAALALAAPNSIAYASSTSPVGRYLTLHHHRSVDPRAIAEVPATPALFTLSFFGSHVPAPREPETDGLSRNPDDCVKYGCIDNGGG